MPRARRTLLDAVRVLRPASDAEALILTGLVLVSGRRVTDPAHEVPRGAVVLVLRPPSPRGHAKLQAALRHFGVPVEGRTALDVGAGAGGFTRALLDAGARRVYAVDAGFG